MFTPATASPEARLRRWLLLNDQDLANHAVDAAEQHDGLRGGAEGGRDGVNRAQFRALLNTARLCATDADLKRFVKSRAERRAKAGAGQETKAAFWDGVLETLRTLDDAFVADALTSCDVPEADSASIQSGAFDARAARMAIWRTYLQHLVAHAQLLSVRHEDRSGSRY